eukprot:1374810-Amorphochlora_amoeboformis.AAC.1
MGYVIFINLRHVAMTFQTISKLNRNPINVCVTQRDARMDANNPSPTLFLSVSLLTMLRNPGETRYGWDLPGTFSGIP